MMIVVVLVETKIMIMAMVMVMVTMAVVAPSGQSAMAFDKGSPKEGGRDNGLFHGGTSEGLRMFFATHFSCHGYRERKPLQGSPAQSV
ncbi:hypothetical protein [Methylococcus sp. BF19-07]|uniref:hypothetical protein n=1 Tax=Methylococcus sp. BF19-07 TaxID=2743472 RepID=UPI0018E02323|nr:hypothetical protein [Methylococcus sp. BF19-07]